MRKRRKPLYGRCFGSFFGIPLFLGTENRQELFRGSQPDWQRRWNHDTTILSCSRRSAQSAHCNRVVGIAIWSRAMNLRAECRAEARRYRDYNEGAISRVKLEAQEELCHFRLRRR